eukprot:CAMPEP_0113488606 /NCGR_PEP_ID=MMETSP0014_2-20120614/26103_1 /TAXON_ID=2857 /ORGANISM="Nitzschia sp." /LENGTH=760 /DNA_ID=CAMNT_0000382323 /DNA_START=628 /DNA_END=2910 /DNA_ORIENTATION=+ /assembly_acc=CAM_ASM_000159
MRVLMIMMPSLLLLILLLSGFLPVASATIDTSPSPLPPLVVKSKKFDHRGCVLESCTNIQQLMHRGGAAHVVDENLDQQSGHVFDSHGFNSNNHNDDDAGSAFRGGNTTTPDTTSEVLPFHNEENEDEVEKYNDESEIYESDSDGDGDGNDDVVQFDPSYPKTKEEYDFIYNSLTNNVMFQSLSDESLDRLVHAFEKTVATLSDPQPIIRQGDPCVIATSDDSASNNSTMDTTTISEEETTPTTYVYMLYNGYCNVYVDGQLVPEPYGTIHERGTIFGELGVFYEKPRSATIVAKSNTVTLFQIDGRIFQSILLFGENDDSSSSSSSSTSTSKKIEQDKNSSSKNDKRSWSSSSSSSPSLPPPLVLQEIDDVINQISGTSTYSKLYKGRIIRQYNPTRKWLYRRITGTVFKQTYKTVLANMVMSAIVIVGAKLWTRTTEQQLSPAGGFFMPPDPTHPFIQRLNIVRLIWKYQMSLTTFLLTFFMNTAYKFWYEIYDMARSIQGRMNDFQLLLATSTSRNADGTYTEQSVQLLNDVGSFSRLFHILYWASSARRFSVLTTPLGLQRLASRGMMTTRQLRVLQQIMSQSHVPPHNACIEWMMIRVWEGIADGTLRNDPGLSNQLLELSCRLRGTFASMNDFLEARMPMPYTHFVQILVDSFIALSPIALYAELGAYSIFCVAILTLFYTGLLDLAKVFLDPLDNEEFARETNNMDIGVLIRESNSGSVRWKNAGSHLPFDVPAFAASASTAATGTFPSDEKI